MTALPVLDRCLWNLHKNDIGIFAEDEFEAVPDLVRRVRIKDERLEGEVAAGGLGDHRVERIVGRRWDGAGRSGRRRRTKDALVVQNAADLGSGCGGSRIRIRDGDEWGAAENGGGKAATGGRAQEGGEVVVPRNVLERKRRASACERRASEEGEEGAGVRRRVRHDASIERIGEG